MLIFCGLNADFHYLKRFEAGFWFIFLSRHVSHSFHPVWMVLADEINKAGPF